MKRILFLVILCSLISLPLHSQTTENGDSTITLTIEEARILTKMTEDLKWTKKELAVSDSIIAHQDSVITLKNEMIKYKELQIQETIKKEKTKKLKTGLLSGGLGLAVGIILGLIL